MKESTGGALLLSLAAGILIIFIIFSAFFINYGKTFKIKNRVINEIEQQEGITKTEILDFIENKTKYNGSSPDICYRSIKKSGVIVGVAFKIVLYMNFDRNIVGDNLKLKIPISGETRMIESGALYENILNNPSSIQSILDGMSAC